jgi:hypothetical protein
MEKVTMSIEGTAEEVNNALKTLAGIVVSQAHPAEAKAPPGAWSDGEIETFFGGLKENARRILREIAKQPEGYPRDQLVANLGMSGRTAGGSLSSVGHNRRKLYPKKPRPVELQDNEYRMLPEFAQWLSSHGGE